MGWDCDCLAQNNQQICEHVIATALRVMVNDAESCKDDRIQMNDENKIYYYLLENYSKKELADILLGYIASKNADWNKWLLKAGGADVAEVVDEKYPALLKIQAEVDTALPKESLWGWSEVHAYFDHANTEFESLWDAMDELSVNEQWQLINYIIERLNLVLEHIDDSNGERFGIEGIINDRMPKIFSELDWSAQAKAEWLFDQLTECSFDVFPEIKSEFYEQCMTNAYFIELCQKELDSFNGEGTCDWELRKYAGFLIDSVSDWREVGKIKQKILYHQNDYLELCQFYLEHDDALEAEYWLANCRKKFTSPSELVDCDRMDIKIRTQLGEKKQAWQLANAIFEQKPSFYEYQTLNELKTKLGIEDEGFLTRVEQRLEEFGESQTSTRWGYRRVDNLLEFYLSLGELDKACDWVDVHEVSSKLLLKLADAIVVTRPNDTLRHYLAVISSTIEQTNNNAYEEAIRYLKTLEQLLQSSPEILQLFYLKIKELAVTYKIKRNMRALFYQHYGPYL